MFALGIHFTNVNFPKSISAELQHRGGFAHRGVHLPRVPNIKTEGSMRKNSEDLSQVGNRLTNQFPFVHVFNAKKLFENRPPQRLMHRVGMHNDRPTTPCHLLQGADSDRLEVSIQVARSMERNILKMSQIQFAERFDERPYKICTSHASIIGLRPEATGMPPHYLELSLFRMSTHSIAAAVSQLC
jgi:hypothetical protein